MKEFELFEYIKELPPQTAQEEVGHTAWVFLHTLAKHLPNDPVVQARAFELLKWIVQLQPCGQCVVSGNQYINDHAFNGDFKTYINGMHNHINTNTKKEFIGNGQTFQPYIIRQKSPMKDYIFEVMVSLK
jgi:hypothetical protein